MEQANSLTGTIGQLNSNLLVIATKGQTIFEYTQGLFSMGRARKPKVWKLFIIIAMFTTWLISTHYGAVPLVLDSISSHTTWRVRIKCVGVTRDSVPGQCQVFLSCAAGPENAKLYSILFPNGSSFYTNTFLFMPTLHAKNLEMKACGSQLRLFCNF